MDVIEFFENEVNVKSHDDFLDRYMMIYNSLQDVLKFYDEALRKNSERLKQIAEEGAVLKLKNGDRLFLRPKNCGKPGCNFCPHNLVWALGRYIQTKDGQEMIKWKNKQYAIDKVSWSRLKNLSESDREKYNRVRDKVKNLIQKRKEISDERLWFKKICNLANGFLKNLESELFG
jgi:hypothetical protein